MLTKADLEQLIGLAERGAATVVQSLCNQPGGLAESQKITDQVVPLLERARAAAEAIVEEE